MFRIFQTDAFTSQVFGGNPAAVVPLEYWIDDAVLQAIAAENNLAETAYLVPVSDGWELRWFTPTAEVALCGHATLAAAHVLVTQLDCTDSVLNFHTRESGTLTVACNQDGSFSMSFPAIQALETIEANDVQNVSAALGSKPERVMYGHYSPDQIDFVAVFKTEEIISALKPNLAQFSKLNSRGVIATALGNSCDFVSRYFGPNFGIDEDPVTGSAHSLLTPFWSNIIGKLDMEARQISPRGGEIHCTLNNDRVVLTGHAINYLEGTIYF